MKYWYKLLVAWRKKNRTGLTIPFLIGSQNFLDSNDNQSIETLLYDISKDKHEIYLTYCPHINELILGLKERNYGNIKGEFLKNSDNSPGKVYVSKVILDDTKESRIEEVIDILKNKYCYQIENKLFSKNDEQWTDFTEADILFIKENI